MTIFKNTQSLLPQEKYPIEDLSYSLRRYYVDKFFTEKASSLRGRCLDLGGNKVQKRGCFDIAAYDLQIVYANVSPEKHPDVIADACNTPFKTSVFDGVICAEVLEHIKTPTLVLQEILRILKPGGLVLITVPFLFREHADPYDYARYTSYFWEENLFTLGFKDVEIIRQGLYWSVIVEFLGLYVYESRKNRWHSRISRWLMRKSIIYARHRMLKTEQSQSYQTNSFFSSFPGGFGIAAKKSD